MSKLVVFATVAAVLGSTTIGATKARVYAAGDSATTEPRPARLAWGDFDGDERVDVIALYPSGEARLQRNQGDGSFRDATLDAGLPLDARSVDAVWVDFDGDGHVDLHLVGPRVAQRLFRNQGDGTFVDVTARMGLGVVADEVGASWFDYDGDERVDVLVTTTSDERLFHNDAARGFEQVELSALAPVSRVLVVADPQSNSRTDEAPRTALAARERRDGDNSPIHPTPRGASQGNRALTGLPPIGSGASSSGPLAIGNRCPQQLKDVVSGSCYPLSTTPALGALYPLGPEFNIDSSGNVGIGTTAPQTALDVRDHGASGTARTILTLRTPESVNGTEGRLDWAQSGSVSGRIANTWEGGGALGLGFTTYDGGLVERMRITAQGNVGIGTPTPAWSARLHVSNGQLAVSQNHTTGDTGVFINGSYNGTGRAAIGSSSNNEPRGPLSLVTADGERMTIDVNGNVGVGTTAPAHRLQVAAGDIALDNDRSLRIATTSGAYERVMSVDAGNAVAVGAIENQATHVRVFAGGAERMRVTTGGDVGIGTSSPSHKLTVAGDIRITSGGLVFPNGSVQSVAATSGIVSVNGATGPALSIVGTGGASVSTSGNTITITNHVSNCTWNGKTYTTGAQCWTGITPGAGQCQMQECEANGSWSTFNQSASFCSNACGT